MGDSTSTLPHSTGVFRYSVPDFSISASKRGLFSFPANKSVSEYSHHLHDARTDPILLPGREGLDTHGFTYIKHKSILSESGDPATDWYSGNNVEDIYLPEVKKLVRDLTGAQSVGVVSVAFRRRLPDEKEEKLDFYREKGCELDQQLEKLPRDTPMIYGKQQTQSLEPAHIAHIDYTLAGLKSSIRYCRHDLADLAKPVIGAENSLTHGSASSESIPRYAAYSIWRPVRTVKRDPLAVCDMRTVTAAECVPSKYRHLSDVTQSGEYMMESVHILPPKNAEQQKWYWMPEQRDDEVLVIKFADSGDMQGMEKGEKPLGGICGVGGAPHCSPILPGTDELEPRCSIEVRVMAFW